MEHLFLTNIELFARVGGGGFGGSGGGSNGGGGGGLLAGIAMIGFVPAYCRRQIGRAFNWLFNCCSFVFANVEEFFISVKS